MSIVKGSRNAILLSHKQNLRCVIIARSSVPLSKTEGCHDALGARQCVTAPSNAKSSHGRRVINYIAGVSPDILLEFNRQSNSVHVTYYSIT